MNRIFWLSDKWYCTCIDLLTSVLKRGTQLSFVGLKHNMKTFGDVLGKSAIPVLPDYISGHRSVCDRIFRDVITAAWKHLLRNLSLPDGKELEKELMERNFCWENICKENSYLKVVLLLQFRGITKVSKCVKKRSSVTRMKTLKASAKRELRIRVIHLGGEKYVVSSPQTFQSHITSQSLRTKILGHSSVVPWRRW